MSTKHIELAGSISRDTLDGYHAANVLGHTMSPCSKKYKAIGAMGKSNEPDEYCYERLL